MKKITPFAVLLTALAAFSLQSNAQKDSTTIYKAWDDFLARIRKEKTISAATIIKIAASDPKLISIRDQLISSVNQSLSLKDASEPWKEYTASYQHKPGDLTLLPLMEEAPPPIHILPVAGQTDIDALFKPYIEKIKTQDRQLAEQSKNNKIGDVYKKEGEEGLQKRAMAQANQSAMIQQMGGMEALMKMSDAERKVAAMKMANDLKANPSLILANQNVDPKNAQQREKMMADRNESKYVQDITLMNVRVQNRVGAAASRYNKDMESINEWETDVKSKIESWYKSRYAAIAIVELGEYGHDKDPQQVISLNAALECLRYFTLEAPEMQMRAESWQQYKTRCKLAIAELNDFAGDYKWGKSSSSNIFAPSADQQAAAGMSAVYGLMIQLAEEAKNITVTGKGYQKRFDEQER